MITYIKATVSDAALLTELSRAIYKEHYLHLWHPGGAAWYMDEYAYAGHKIKNDLIDPGIEYLFAVEKDVYLGYMKLVLNATLPGYESIDALEVERIYLYKKFTGKGLGKEFMQLAMAKAKELNRDIIFLKAMDSSQEAIEFYKGLGYEICGSMQLPMPAFSLMKEKYRAMVIMKREVD